jgi:predicted Zn-dependent peptidase
MYKLIQLKNGLRVVLEHIDYVNSVSVGLWVNNGSRNEDANNNGISHFIEHMFFKGTEKRSAKQIAEEIEDVGGQLNAFTGKEATCYYIKALDTHLDLSLDILSDMLFRSKFAEEDIEKEKGVVIEEINMSEDTPEDVLSDLHSKAIWGDDSISLPILGVIDTVNAFTREQLTEYISKHYTPKNSVVSICGKIDVNEVEKLVEEYFGHWNSETNTTITYTTPPIIDRCLSRKKNIEQLHISLGLQGVPLGEEDLYTLLLLNNILGGGVSSLLFQTVREEHGLCYSIYSYPASFRNTGIVNVYTSLTPNYAAEALTLIKEEIYNFSKTRISDEKLHKAKEQIKGSYILGLESTSSRMFSNGKSVLFQNKINDPRNVMSKIDAINMNSVNNVMESTFAKGILNSAFVGNEINIDLYKSILMSDDYAYKQSKLTKL